MSHQSDLIAEDILSYLKQHENKELLRFITCGSVDDGKSTLIGRLLHDSKLIYEDQLASIKKESLRKGDGDEVDLALLVDGLQAEREQGITIDVAYRYFSTEKRKFIIADTPGHEQYTRNMATGASTANLAIILMDARKGVLTQTKRHSFIVNLLGIKHIVVAINKMDMVDYNKSVFERIKEAYLKFSEEIGIKDIYFVPLSALKGDNVVTLSQKTPWYKGHSLIHILENIEILSDTNFEILRFPIQYVSRPNMAFRGYSGTLASGIIRRNDRITVLPSKKESTIKSIITFDYELDYAYPPMAVTITLEDEIDISRGDMIVRSDQIPEVSDRFEVMIVWMSENPMKLEQFYDIKRATTSIQGKIISLIYKININTLKKEKSDYLELNEIGLCRLELSKAIAYDNYNVLRGTGGLIIIDRITNNTVAAGMIISKDIKYSETDDAKIEKIIYSDFEKELNSLIRKYYPHWNVKQI